MPGLVKKLAKGDKDLAIAWADRQVTTTVGGKASDQTFASPALAAEAFADAVRAKLKAGYVAKRAPVKPQVTALRKAVGWYELVNAFADDELPDVYAVMRAEEHTIGRAIYAFRRRPHEAAVAYLVGLADDSQGYEVDDLVKGFVFVAKDPEAATWIVREVGPAAAKLDNEYARKRLQRMVDRIAKGPKPAPKAPAKPKAGSTEAELLAAIASAPGDDGPRQVYADWLLDQGIGWGEVITNALQVARLPEDDQYAAHKKLGKLADKHAKAWLAPIRPFIRSWQYERGLVSDVTCDAQLFAQAGAAIADRAPRAILRLTGLKKSGLDALVASPLGRFATVFLGSNRLDDAAIAKLVGSPTIAGVELLELDHNLFADAGIRAIASSPHLASLVELRCARFEHTCSVDAFAALVASSRLPRLATLSLAVMGTGVGAALASAKAPLAQVALSVDHFDDDDAAAIAKARGLATLKTLAIQHWTGTPELTDRGALALLDSRVVKLDSLSLDTSRLSAAVRKRIDG